MKKKNVLIVTLAIVFAAAMLLAFMKPIASGFKGILKRDANPVDEYFAETPTAAPAPTEEEEAAEDADNSAEEAEEASADESADISEVTTDETIADQELSSQG